MNTNELRAEALCQIDKTYDQFLTVANSSAKLRFFFKRMFRSSPDAQRLWGVLFAVGDVRTFLTVVSQEEVAKGYKGYKILTLDKMLATVKAYDDEVAAGRKFGALKKVGRAYGLFPTTVKKLVDKVAEADAELKLSLADEIAVKASALPVVFGALMRGQR